jgi:glycosyltransferase EpsJ
VPRLSVVLPVYGTEQWLPACLDSLAAQTYADYEVVVVDDGSPDDSAALVERRAQADPRIRLVRQANAGLGAARNTGVAHATGELLAFADSDDDLPPAALERMVASTDRTGSELVVGSVERVSPARRWLLPRVAANHAVERLGITLHDQPLLLADVFAWNKLYRRELWERAGLSFPVGTAYEDQPALTRALLAARGIDVLTDVVYHWRVREGSISSRRHRLDDLRDRIATKHDTAAVVATHGDPALDRVLHAEVLPADMWEYFRAAVDGPEQPEAYWRMLVDGTRDLWRQHPFERADLPLRQRLMGWLVQQDRRDDLARLVALLDGAGLPRPHPWHDDPALPRELAGPDGPAAAR